MKVHYTVAGSAQPGRDYQPLSGVVKFKRFQNAALIRLQALFEPGGVPGSVVKIKFQPQGDYTVEGGRTVKIPLPAGGD